MEAQPALVPPRRYFPHLFAFQDKRFAVDPASGSVHLLDEQGWTVLRALLDVVEIENRSGDPEQPAQNRAGWLFDLMDRQGGSGFWTHESIRRMDPIAVEEVIGELDELIRDGLLFSTDEPTGFRLEAGNFVVKSLCLNVAHTCNLACEYCFAGKGDFGGPKGLMSEETARAAVDFLIDHSGNRKALDIDFFGGEPLLNFGVVQKTIDYARSRASETGKTFSFTLTTNGVLLSGEIIDYLRSAEVNLVLSLDGRREVTDRMRPGKGSHRNSSTYDRILPHFTKAHQAYSDCSAYCYVRGTYTANNTDFGSDVLHLADLGFTTISVEPVISGPEADYALRDQHLPELSAEYEKLALEYVKRAREGRPFTFFHFNVDLDTGPCLAKRITGCGAGYEYLAVTPEGHLYPCHQFVGREKYKVGTLESGVIRTDLVQQFMDANVLRKPACRECWARYYCGGGCHANADAFNGSLESPYLLGCELQRKRLECAFFARASLEPEFKTA